MTFLLILGLAVLGLLALFAWALLRVAAQTDEDREQEWLAEDDERRTGNWRRI